MILIYKQIWKVIYYGRTWRRGR